MSICQYVYQGGKKKGVKCTKKATVFVNEMCFCGTETEKDGVKKYTGHAKFGLNQIFKTQKKKCTFDSNRISSSPVKSPSSPVKSPSSPVKSPSKVEEQEDEIKICEYVPTRGKLQGIRCTKVATIPIDGKYYCGKKKELENGKVEYTMHARSGYNASIKTPKKKNFSNKDKTVYEKSNILKQVLEKKSCILSKNILFDRWYDPITLMIVDKNTLKVIGKESEAKDNPDPLPLTKQDINICEISGWRFDLSNVEEN